MCSKGWDQNLQDGVIKGHINTSCRSNMIIPSTLLTFVSPDVEPQPGFESEHAPGRTHSLYEQFSCPSPSPECPAVPFFSVFWSFRPPRLCPPPPPQPNYSTLL